MNNSLSDWPATRSSVNDDANDDSIETDGRGEDDDDEHANEGWSVLSGDKGSAASQHSDANSTEYIWETNGDSNPEGSVAWVLS